MKFTYILLIFLSLTFPAYAAKDTVYHWEVLEVYDGDTIKVKTDFLPSELKLSVRIRGVDTGEKDGRAKCENELEMGKRAIKFVTRLISEADVITFTNLEWDKFGGRVVADVNIDGISLTKRLLNSGLAKPFSGKTTKDSWCD